MRRIAALAMALAVSGLAFGERGALAVGGRLHFAGDGGLHEVSVQRQVSPSMYLGSLDGYGGALNATIVAAGDGGWKMDVDDWRTRRVWHVSGDGGAVQVSVQGKPSRMRRCRSMRLGVPGNGQGGALHSQKKVASSAELTSGWPVDPVTNEIDVLVVFDKTAVALIEGRKDTIADFGAMQVAKMNAALANSGLSGDFKMTLCGTYAADFDVTRDCGWRRSIALSVALELAADGMGTVWKAIRAERDRVGADIVMILADSNPGVPLDEIGGLVGISYGLEYDSANGRFGLVKQQVDVYREGAYGACDVRIVELDHTFAHEAGHIMGAGHSDLLSPDYSAPGPQLFQYSCALMYKDAVDGEHYYTVMGYDSMDGKYDSVAYSEIPYYSSPALAHPVTGSALGDESHDNARTLRETYAVISQYRVNAARSEKEQDEQDQADKPDQSDKSAEQQADTEAWKRARTLRGKAVQALQPPNDVRGLFEIKCGKANRKGMAKVSATFTGLDGKKRRYGATTVDVRGKNRVEVKWRDDAGELVVTIEGGKFTGGHNADGGLSVETAEVGGETWKDAKLAFLSVPGTVDGQEVWRWPDGEHVAMQGGRWVCDKADKVKWKTFRCVDGVCPECAAAWVVVGSAADGCSEQTGRNLCNLKLTYKAKTGTFKGSFRLYMYREGRQKGAKASAKVTGVVVEGVGYGQATAKKEGPWTVTVR